MDAPAWRSAARGASARAAADDLEVKSWRPERLTEDQQADNS